MGRVKGGSFDCFSLEWDTDYFGVSSARVNLNGEIDEKDQEEIINFCKKYKFITISNANNIKENNYWIGTKTDAFLSDMNVQFIKIIEDNKDEKDYKNEEIYILNNLSTNSQIIEIAGSSFKYSRFFNDPNFPKKQAENIYLHWTECAFNQKNKYFIINEIEGQIIGYILFSIDKKYIKIELIAVSEKFKGKKVGKSLIKSLESFSIKKGINVIKVGTQVDNVSAVQFYEKMGFKYSGCLSLYHLWR